MEISKCELKKESLYQTVAAKLEEIILSDKSGADKKLPSEQTLAEQFGVSLPVVRQALVLLRERGVIISKNGDGSYVSPLQKEKLTETLVRIAKVEDIEPRDIFSIRLTLECMAVQLAAKSISEEDISKLTELNEKMKQASGKERAELDVEFHAQIAEAGGNTLLSMFVRSLATQLEDVIEAAGKASGSNQLGTDEHGKLISLLKKHKANSAEALIKKHLDTSMKNYEEVINSAK